MAWEEVILKLFLVLLGISIFILAINFAQKFGMLFGVIPSRSTALILDSLATLSLATPSKVKIEYEYTSPLNFELKTKHGIICSFVGLEKEIRIDCFFPSTYFECANDFSIQKNKETKFVLKKEERVKLRINGEEC